MYVHLDIYIHNYQRRTMTRRIVCYTYLCLYIHIYKCMCTIISFGLAHASKWPHINMCIYQHTYVYTYTYIYGYIIYLYMYKCLCTHLYTIHIYTHTQRCIYIYICKQQPASDRRAPHRCRPIYIHMPIHICIYVYIQCKYVYICG